MKNSIVRLNYNCRMFYVVIFVFILLLPYLQSSAIAQNLLKYLGQPTPGNVPIRFPPDSLLANDEWFWHGSPVFTPDGLEMYWTKIYQPGPGGQRLSDHHLQITIMQK